MELRKREKHSKPTKKDVWNKVAELHPQSSSKQARFSKKHTKELEKWKKNEESNWEIEDILQQRVNPEGVHEVLIKWRNWPSKFNTWEPVENLDDELPNVLKTIEKEKEEKRNARKRNRERQRSESPTWGEVEEVRGEKILNGKQYYLVKWKDSPEDENSWEPEEHLVGVDLQFLKKTETEQKISSKTDLSNTMKPKEVMSMAEETKLEAPKQKGSEEVPIHPHVQQDLTLNAKNDKNQGFEENEYKGYSTAGYYPEEGLMSTGGVYMTSQEPVKYNQYNQIYMEQKVQYLSRSIQSEDYFQGNFDISKYFLPGSVFLNNAGPEDKSAYSHRIENHRYDREGNVEAFMVVATNKYDSSIMPAVFWSETKDARLRYAAEVMEYLEMINSKFGNSRFMELGSARFYD